MLGQNTLGIGRGGGADKLVEIVQTVPVGRVPDSQSLYIVIPTGKEQKELL